MATSTGVASNHDFLTDYLYEVRALLHDTQCAYYQDSDLNRWINEARRQVCVDTGCLRTLLVLTFPASVAQYNIGGVYMLNDVPTPTGAVAPLQLVTGGGGAATANTTTVPMTISVTAAGAYTTPPIVTISAPGMNVSASATAVLSSSQTYTTQSIASESGNGQIMNSTDLDATGGQMYGSSVRLNVNATGWGEICGGNKVPNPGYNALSSEPGPSGFGFCADTIYTLKPGNMYAIDTNTVAIQVYASAGLSVTADIYLRFWTFDWATQTYSSEPFVLLKSSAYQFQSTGTVDNWDVISDNDVYIPSGTYIYVDCVINITSLSGWTADAVIGFGAASGGANYYALKFNAVYNQAGFNISVIDVTSDAGQYNAQSVTPTVNIVASGYAASVSDNGSGFLQIDSQGSGLCSGVFIQDAAGTLTPITSADVSIMPCNIASVDGITLIWNTQRIALRNMAFQDFSAEWRGWTQYSNYPLAYSVYGNSIYIAPTPNQAYQYELDCIMYPNDLIDYATIGQIADANTIACVKYWAAYLARMYSQQLEEASAFKQLYQQALITATNSYTTRLARPYRDNENLDW